MLCRSRRSLESPAVKTSHTGVARTTPKMNPWKSPAEPHSVSTPHSEREAGRDHAAWAALRWHGAWRIWMTGPPWPGDRATPAPPATWPYERRVTGASWTADRHRSRAGKGCGRSHLRVGGAATADTPAFGRYAGRKRESWRTGMSADDGRGRCPWWSSPHLRFPPRQQRHL